MRGRAEDYAICLLAGSVAESIITQAPLSRFLATNSSDYAQVREIAELLSANRRLEHSPEAERALLRLWQARTVALLSQHIVWQAIECTAAELESGGGVLKGKELVSTIENALEEAAEYPELAMEILRNHRARR